MKILVLNSGSSSLKYQVIDTETGEMLVKGYYERIGQVGAFLTQKNIILNIQQKIMKKQFNL